MKKCLICQEKARENNTECPYFGIPEAGEKIIRLRNKYTSLIIEKYNPSEGVGLEKEKVKIKQEIERQNSERKSKDRIDGFFDGDSKWIIFRKRDGAQILRSGDR